MMIGDDMTGTLKKRRDRLSKMSFTKNKKRTPEYKVFGLPMIEVHELLCFTALNAQHRSDYFDLNINLQLSLNRIQQNQVLQNATDICDVINVCRTGKMH
jgi:hypothetical protein